MLSTTTFLLSKTFLLSQFSPPLQPMLSTTFLLSNTFLLSQFFPPSAAHAFNDSGYQGSSATLPDFHLSKFFPPSAAHAFNYNIPFIKNIPFITIFPPSAAHAFNYNILFYQTHSFYHNFPPLCSPCFQWFRLPGVICDLTWLPFIKIFPPLCSPCFQLQHSFYQTHSFYHNFPPLCSPCFQLHSFYQTHSFYHNFSPPSAAHAFNYNIPFIKHIPFITIFPPSAAHAFNYMSFIKNIPFIKIFPPPLQPMLSTTTFLLSNTFLLSQFSPTLCSPCFQLHSFYQNFPPSAAHAFNDSGYQGSSATLPDFHLSKFFPPSAAHAFNYNIPFIKHIPFITIFPPSAAHAFNYIPFIKHIPFITIFPPPLQPMLSTTTFLLSNTFLLSQFSPPLQPMLSMIQVTRGHLRPYLFHLSKFPSPLQPMLSTTTFLLSKTFLLSQFSPPLQPMLSTTFLLSKTFLLSQFSPPSAAHALKIDCSKNNCPWPYTFEAGQRPCQANIIKCLLKKHILRITWSELLCGVVVACDPTHKRPGGPSRRQGVSHLRLFQGGG